MPQEVYVFYTGNALGHAAKIRRAGHIFTRGRSTKVPPDLGKILIEEEGFAKGSKETLDGADDAAKASEELLKKLDHEQKAAAKKAAEAAKKAAKAEQPADPEEPGKE